MNYVIEQGDLVESLSGRDKGGIFLVVRVLDGNAEIVDGKIRKVFAIKKKNIKHLKLIKKAGNKSLVEKIIGGEPVGNKTVRKSIADNQKKQEE